MKKVIFLSILTTFSFLKASGAEMSEGLNPWSRSANSQSNALSLPLVDDLEPSLYGAPPANRIHETP